MLINPAITELQHAAADGWRAQKSKLLYTAP
jgi:hypothetical protein